MIDSLAVYKDAAGEIEVMHRSNLSDEEAAKFGSNRSHVNPCGPNENVCAVRVPGVFTGHVKTRV